jgi:DNA (cytosine-5)-methyltransferase 1
LCCGGGGAAAGYARAGYAVVGVDILPQPNYPFEFHQADAKGYPLDGYDLIHASPPCQFFTKLSAYANVGRRFPPVNLVDPIRERLQAHGTPYVIENVQQARLRNPVRLCGVMFGLKLYRHRDFESNLTLTQPKHPKHTELCMRAGYLLPTVERPYMSIHGRNGHISKAWVAKAAEYMGTPWLATDLNNVCEAVPPAYTTLIGMQAAQLLGYTDFGRLAA